MQNIMGEGGLKRNKLICNMKLQFMMANCEIVEFIAIMQTFDWTTQFSSKSADASSMDLLQMDIHRFLN